MKAAEIIEIRKALGLTQNQFAMVMGVSYATVSRWENGHVVPTARQKFDLGRLQQSHVRPARIHDTLINKGLRAVLSMLL